MARRYAYLIALLGVAAFVNKTYPADTDVSGLFGLSWWRHVRTGHFIFEDVNLRRDTTRPSLDMYGLRLGRRYGLLPTLSAEFPFDVSAGSVTLDTIFRTHGLIRKASCLHAGFSPELLLWPSLPGPVSLFIRLGAGANYFWYREQAFLLESPLEEVLIPDQVDEGHVSLHALAGIGMDITLSSRFALTFGYDLRYWRPLRYGYLEGFPVDAVEYREDFISHRAAVGLLLRK